MEKGGLQRTSMLQKFRKGGERFLVVLVNFVSGFKYHETRLTRH
jgi:hypothetical protein